MLSVPRYFSSISDMVFGFHLRLLTLFLRIWSMPDTIQVLNRLFWVPKKKIANRPGLVYKKKKNYNTFSHSSVISNVCLIFYDNIKYKFLMVANVYVYTLLSYINIVQKPRVQGDITVKTTSLGNLKVIGISYLRYISLFFSFLILLGYFNSMQFGL